MRWAVPPGVEAADPAPDVEDVVEIGPAPSAEPRTSLSTRLLAGAGLALTLFGAAGCAAPGPSAPAILCATDTAASRLDQVLSCESVTSPSQLTQPVHRAAYAWEGLRAHMGGDLDSLQERPGDGRITAWPYGQVMAAALDQAQLTGDYTDFEVLVEGLERFRHPDGGYASSRNALGFLGARFYDDNAWLGLVFMQAAQQRPDSDYLARAQEVAGFLQEAQQPDGGLLWEEGNPERTYNTCTFGPSIELALRLYQATGNQEYREFARELTDIMDSRLRQENGLYADHVNVDTGAVNGRIFSYNQGTPVGAHLLWHQLTGDQTHLEKARETARAALEHFGDDGLWREAPAFNAVFFRNLMQLDDPQVEEALDRYLDRAWSHALDPETGLFNRPEHGMGSYEGEGDVSTIDQAALVQLLALQGWAPEDLPMVT